MDMHIHHFINCGVHWGHLRRAVAGPRQTEESRALQCGRHVQQDSSLVILTSTSLLFMVVLLYLWCGPQSTGRSSDSLHNGRSFCYLFLKFSLKPVFITSPVGSCKYSTLAQSCQVSGFSGTGVQKSLHPAPPVSQQVHYAVLPCFETHF